MTWVFGYGSLVWRPAFAFADRAAGFVSGYARRFFQGSPDHRGVPGAPGRVVTLIDAPGERTWGMAYRLDPDSQAHTLEALDAREVAGYERRDVRVTLAQRDVTVAALCYVATPKNPCWLGPASLDEMVRHVRSAPLGRSGDNVDYVLRLADALLQMGAEDAHVFALAEALRPH